MTGRRFPSGFVRGAIVTKMKFFPPVKCGIMKAREQPGPAEKRDVTLRLRPVSRSFLASQPEVGGTSSGNGVSWIQERRELDAIRRAAAGGAPEQ